MYCCVCLLCLLPALLRSLIPFTFVFRHGSRAFSSFASLSLFSFPHPSPRRCGLCPDGLSPYGHLGDGCMDLMMASECSRLMYLRHLIDCARPNVNQLKFRFIDIVRVKAFKFRPLESRAEAGRGDEKSCCPLSCGVS